MSYRMPQKVLFKHCDPAGIVFYPRYFEMINDCVEMFFHDALDFPFEKMLATQGAPTAEITVTFHAPSRHGDQLELVLEVQRVGRTSLDIQTTALCGGDARFTARQTLVLIGGEGRPEPWSPDVRERLLSHLPREAA